MQFTNFLEVSAILATPIGVYFLTKLLYRFYKFTRYTQAQTVIKDRLKSSTHILDISPYQHKKPPTRWYYSYASTSYTEQDMQYSAICGQQDFSILRNIGRASVVALGKAAVYEGSKCVHYIYTKGNTNKYILDSNDSFEIPLTTHTYCLPIDKDLVKTTENYQALDSKATSCGYGHAMLENTVLMQALADSEKTTKFHSVKDISTVYRAFLQFKAGAGKSFLLVLPSNLKPIADDLIITLKQELRYDTKIQLSFVLPDALLYLGISYLLIERTPTLDIALLERGKLTLALTSHKNNHYIQSTSEFSIVIKGLGNVAVFYSTPDKNLESNTCF